MNHPLPPPQTATTTATDEPRATAPLSKAGRRLLLPAAFLLTLVVSQAHAAPSLDRLYRIESIGFLSPANNVDDIFNDFFQEVVHDYLIHQSRLQFQNLSTQNRILTHSHLTYRSLLRDSAILKKTAQSSRLEMLLTAQIIIQPPQTLQLQLDLFHFPEQQRLARVAFTVPVPPQSNLAAKDFLRQPLTEQLDQLFGQIPFLGNITGRNLPQPSLKSGGFAPTGAGIATHSGHPPPTCAELLRNPQTGLLPVGRTAKEIFWDQGDSERSPSLPRARPLQPQKCTPPPPAALSEATVNLGAEHHLQPGDILSIGTLTQVVQHPKLRKIVDWQWRVTGELEVLTPAANVTFTRVLAEDPQHSIAKDQKILKITRQSTQPSPDDNNNGGDDPAHPAHKATPASPSPDTSLTPAPASPLKDPPNVTLPTT